MNDFSLRPIRLSIGHLLTNEYGNYAILSGREYKNYLSGRIDSTLFKKLEEKDIIITNSNRQRIISRYRDSKLQIFQGTSLHIVIPTRRCNLCCIYCHSPIAKAGEMQYDMTKETAEKTVDFIFQSPSSNITIEFQGGEPLLNFEIVKTITLLAKEYAAKKRKKLKFTVVTNLSAMDNQKMDFLLENEVWPCISLDGPRKLQEYNRPKSYSHLKKYAPILQRKTGNALSGICIVTKESFKYKKQIIEEYKKFGFTRIWMQPFHAIGNAKKNLRKISYKPEDYIKFWKETLSYIIEKKIPIKEVSSTFLLRKLIKQENPLFVDLQSPCGAIINQLAYEYDGSVYTCDEGRMVDSDIFKIGNVGMKYKQVVNCQESCSLLSLSVNDTLFCGQCAYKPFCGVCPVLAFAATGSPVPKANSFECRILKAQFTFLLEKYHSDVRYKRIFDGWILTKDL